MRLLALLVPSIIFSGCASLSFSTDGEPFAEYEYGTYGPDLIYNLYPTHITIYGNGQGTVSTPTNEEIGIDQKGPHTVTFEVNSEELKAFQNLIEESNFFSMPEILNNIDVLDGGYKYLTIHTAEKSKRVGGSNPDDKTLQALTDYMVEIVPDGLLQSFHDGIEQHQRETGI